jgi:magnesium chelatase family protein
MLVELQREPVTDEYLQVSSAGEDSASVRRRVTCARVLQKQRRACTNRSLSGNALRQDCRLDRGGRRLLSTAVERLYLSARACDNSLRVARSIADLAGEPEVRAAHLSEALSLRAGWPGEGAGSV